MIITEQKKFEDIELLLKNSKNIVIVGCGRCSTSCQTGGEKEVKEIKEKLEKSGKTIIGTIVIEAPCDERLSKLELRKLNIEKADSILALCCGSGVSVLSDSANKKVFAGLNTLFLGALKRAGLFEERCSLCGECRIHLFNGICPLTRCSKGLLNGPCGGSEKGKCEASKEKDCAWYLIYQKYKEKNELEELKKFRKPKDFINLKPQKIDRITLKTSKK